MAVTAMVSTSDWRAPCCSDWLRATMLPATCCSTARILAIVSVIVEYKRAGVVAGLTNWPPTRTSLNVWANTCARVSLGLLTTLRKLFISCAVSTFSPFTVLR